MQYCAAPSIVISPYQHLQQALGLTAITHVVSILGRSDRLEWPSVGNRKILRLEFDDVGYCSQGWVAPRRDHIVELIEFARSWGGLGSIAIHCRAGSSRSPAAAMIVAASLGVPGAQSLIMRVRTAKAYFRPNEAMLKLADELLQSAPTLVELARAVPIPLRAVPWGAVRVALRSP